MVAFIARRVLRGFILLAAVTALTYLLLDVLPGRGSRHESAGHVLNLIGAQLPATLSLLLGAALLSIVAAVLIGVIAALARGRPINRVATGAVLVVGSTPVFWLGLIALYLFSSDIGSFPILPGAGSYVGITTNAGQWFKSLLLPWLVLAGAQTAICARSLARNMTAALATDYSRAARAGGLRERVVTRRALRAAAVALVPGVASSLGGLLGAAVLTEAVFRIPGIGLLGYHAALRHDLPLLRGIVVLAAAFIILAGVVLDIAHAYLDPRVAQR
jgi:peptide/nickel transport system permease protein